VLAARRCWRQEQGRCRCHPRAARSLTSLPGARPLLPLLAARSLLLAECLRRSQRRFAGFFPDSIAGLMGGLVAACGLM